MNLFKKLSMSFSLVLAMAIVSPALALTATVDVDRVLFEYNKAKTVAEQFKAQEENLQKNLIDAQNKIKQTSSPVEKKNLEASYEKKLKAQAEKIQTERVKKLQEIESDIFKAIDKVSAGQYDLILKKSATIYCPNDITVDVLNHLNGVKSKK